MQQRHVFFSLLVHLVVPVRLTFKQTAAIVGNYDPSLYFPFATYLFEHQTEFFNSVFFNKTEADLYDLFYNYTQEFGVKINKTEFYNLMMNSDTLYNQVVLGYHYGVSRSVIFTPTFFINGVMANMVNQSSTYQQWRDVLDPLYNATSLNPTLLMKNSPQYATFPSALYAPKSNKAAKNSEKSFRPSFN